MKHKLLAIYKIIIAREFYLQTEMCQMGSYRNPKCDTNSNLVRDLCIKADEKRRNLYQEPKV